MNEESSDVFNEIRDKIRIGLYGSIYEKIALQCLLFFGDMVMRGQYPDSGSRGSIQAGLAAIKCAAVVFSECAEIAKSDDARRKFGNLATFGLIQAATHLIEATEMILEALNLPARTLKDGRRYWDFRNNHTHLRRTGKKAADKYGFRIHEMLTDGSGFGFIRYASYDSEQSGFSVQSFNFEDGLRELSIDLQKAFDACLAAIPVRD